IDVKSSRIELALTIDSKPARWVLHADAQGKVVWDGAKSPVPEGARGEVRQRLADGVVTCELAIPLSSIVPMRDAKLPGGGRIGMDLALRNDDPFSKQGSSPLVRVAETLSLHWLTQEQESAGLAVARSLLDMERSWDFLEQVWRTRVQTGTSTAEFYRDFI